MADPIGEVPREAEFGLSRPMDVPVTCLADRDQVSDVARLCLVEPDWNDVMSVETATNLPTARASECVLLVDSGRVLGRPPSDALPLRAKPSTPKVAPHS